MLISQCVVCDFELLYIYNLIENRFNLVKIKSLFLKINLKLSEKVEIDKYVFEGILNI